MTRAWRGAVEVEAGSRRAWPHLPGRAVPRQVWISEDGTVVRILDSGAVEAVFPGSLPRDPLAGVFARAA